MVKPEHVLYQLYSTITTWPPAECVEIWPNFICAPKSYLFYPVPIFDHILPLMYQHLPRSLFVTAARVKYSNILQHLSILSVLTSGLICIAANLSENFLSKAFQLGQLGWTFSEQSISNTYRLNFFWDPLNRRQSLFTFHSSGKMDWLGPGGFPIRFWALQMDSTHQGCSPRPTEKQAVPPCPAKSRPCPAPPLPEKLTKSAGCSGAKLTADSIDTPFSLCPQMIFRHASVSSTYPCKLVSK